MSSAVIVLGGIGLVSGAVLSLASRLFHVDEDPRIKEAQDLLPGANCGGCGHAGCAAYAESIVNGGDAVNLCVVGQAETADAVARFMGYEVIASEPKTACSQCDGGYRADQKYEYSGVQDCRAAMQLYHGPIRCESGCLGMGTCVAACKFGAIEIGEDRLPKFNWNLCVGCGACVEICPKSIITLTSSEISILRWNRHMECLSPCRQACPAQINIPKYLGHARRGEYAEALLTIKERNPLPASTGRVCPELCAVQCRRTIHDDPLAINQVKRFVADWERNNDRRTAIPAASFREHKVAIIGGGPSGLSAAFYLRRLGYAVRIFEMNHKLGGMLRYGIPEYRLPKEALDWDIEGVLELGVEVTTGVALGRDFTLQDLRTQGFGAIYLAIGGWVGRVVPLPGKELQGVYPAIDYLKYLQTAKGAARGLRVAVLGAGNVAMDAARSAIRDGAKSVTILYRSRREDMKANPHEIVEAEEEGVEMRCLLSPVRVVGADGRVTGIETQRVELDEPDPDGRRRVKPVEGSEEIVSCDAVVFAVGQSTQLDFLEQPGSEGIERTRYGTIEADEETLQTGALDVFTGGDCFTGPGLLVEAVAAGRFAARSIHYYLKDGMIPLIEDAQREMIPNALLDSIVNVSVRPKATAHELIGIEERTTTWLEVEGTIDEEAVRCETDRCLNCGIYCYDTDFGADAVRTVASCPNEPRLIADAESSRMDQP